MKGPYCVYERDRDYPVYTFAIRDAEGGVLCSIECADYEQARAIAKGMAGVLNAAPADQSLNDMLTAMRDRGTV